MHLRHLLLLGALALPAQTPAPKALPPAPVPPKPAAPKAAPAVRPAPAAPAKAPIASSSTPADPVVFQVGEEKMTRSQFDKFFGQLPADLQREAATGGKRRLAERLAELKALAMEARLRGLDQTPEVRQQIALQVDNVLASVLYQTLLAGAAPDQAALLKYYEEHKSEYEKVTARHILVRFQGSRVPVKPNQKELTDAEALAKVKELGARLQKGEDFAMLAQAESDDTGSAASGGSLGSFGHGQMAPEFEKAVFSQPAGQVGEPVKTQFGYHLIKVDQRGQQSLAEVRPAIEQRLKPQGAQKLLEEVRRKFASVLDETYFGKPAATPPQP